ncbi:MAG: hypothetical protein KAY50_09810 [Chitinophagaceae bacterium]|nr:hypothetical protein [Chitinophagaceae bacterium]
MKCNQCNMLQISTGGISLPCHETGCPNSKKVWNEEDEIWEEPETDDFEDGWEDNYDDDQDDDDYEYQDEDLGCTGHGDISHSDADPGL